MTKYGHDHANLCAIIIFTYNYSKLESNILLLQSFMVLWLHARFLVLFNPLHIHTLRFWKIFKLSLFIWMKICQIYKLYLSQTSILETKLKSAFTDRFTRSWNVMIVHDPCKCKIHILEMYKVIGDYFLQNWFTWISVK